jgi:TonB family protein
MRTTKTQRHKDFLCSLCLCVFVVFTPFNHQQSAISIALLFEDDTARATEPALRQAIATEGLTLQEQSIIDAASKTLQLPNLFNLTRDQARGYGLALGVDLFAVTRSRLVERADVGANVYGECYLAIAFVGTRSGQLLGFDLIETRGNTTALALAAARDQVKERAAGYARQLRLGFKQQFETRQLDAEDLAAIELPEDPAPDFKPPSFTSRKQPEYTETARKMGISAVVEVEAVLRRDSTVGNVEVVRWAGFGLDESAIEAVKQLKFKPAIMKDQPISCRALIRYNFNYKIE